MGIVFGISVAIGFFWLFEIWVKEHYKLARMMREAGIYCSLAHRMSALRNAERAIALEGTMDDITIEKALIQQAYKSQDSLKRFLVGAFVLTILGSLAGKMIG